MDGKYRRFKVRQDGSTSVVTCIISDHCKPNKRLLLPLVVPPLRGYKSAPKPGVRHKKKWHK
ncbi:hypothetical protein MnBA_17360 [Marinobacterium sp. BA1]